MYCNLSDTQALVLYPQIVLASLSVVFSILMILSYYSINSLQVFYFRIVIYVAFTDGLRSILYIIPPNEIQPGIFCITVAILDTALAFNLILWTSLISLILYQVIVNSKENFQQYEKTFKILSFTFPLFYLLPLSTNSYGKNSTVCTYKNTLAGNIWRLFLYSLPAWAFSLASIYAFCKIFYKFRQIEIKKETKELVETVFIYPILLFIVLILVTLVRVLEIFSEDSCYFFTLYSISITLTSAQGFLNAIVFFCTPVVKEALKSKIRQKRIYSMFVRENQSPLRRGTEINLLESTDSFVNQVY